MLPIELLFSFAVVQLPDSLREAAELDSPLTNVALMPLTVRFEADVDSASIISALQEAIVAEDADEHSINLLHRQKMMLRLTRQSPPPCPAKIADR